jgi:myo-inositol-1(or 4)-monophosphatase
MHAREFEAVAIDAAHAGGKVLRARFRTEVASRMEVKGLHDYVTSVDREAESVILDFLRARFPDHALMSEEGSPDAERAAYRWIVDPLDGTTNFAHGLSPFSVSIALEDGDGLLAGAVYDPMHEETFHAHRGGGARLNDQPIRCSDPGEPDRALIATGFPFRELSRLARYMRAFERVVRSTAGLRRAGSAAIDLAYTACGRYDGFFELGLSRWDLAAGALLILEAGGTVSDLSGGRGYLDSGDVVAGGAAMHAMLLEITRETLG